MIYPTVYLITVGWNGAWRVRVGRWRGRFEGSEMAPPIKIPKNERFYRFLSTLGAEQDYGKVHIEADVALHDVLD